MENAAKGLLIAGGILMAVIVLSLGARIFTTFGSEAQTHNQAITEQEIWAFNNKFMDCIDNNNQATIQDIITMINLALATENEEIPVLVVLKKTGVIEQYGCVFGETGVRCTNANLTKKLQDDLANSTKKRYKVTKVDKYTEADSNPYIIGAIKQITIDFN